MSVTIEELERREAVAAALCELDDIRNGTRIFPGWQKDEKLRQTYGKLADQMITLLDVGSGVATKVSSKKRLRERIEFLTTIPSQIAYELRQGKPTTAEDPKAS